MDATSLKLLAAAASASASALAFVAYRRASAAASGAALSNPGGTGIADGADDTKAPETTSLIRRIVSPLATQIRPSNQAELEVMTTGLMNAGRRGRDAIDRFCEEKIISLFGGMALGLFVAVTVGGLAGFLMSLLIIVMGILGPSKLVASRATNRRELVSEGLPAAVDLLTTCVEAGLSLEQSVARVAREISLSSPTLAEELSITAREFEAGVALPDALRRLARRVGLDDLSALCGVIAQAHGLGAPVGNTLREYAKSSRIRRMSTLEERAGKLAAQMTLPLAICLLPAAMMIILGPAVVQLVRALQ